MIYYNEINSYAAAWLRNLSKANLIAEGHVDERSIVDVRADDLSGYAQHHFFAGIGGWSYALKLAGWPDNVPVWTGSCPCQPFSAAGAGKAADDPRHLWPKWLPLIVERHPPIIFGEQVEAAIGWGWLDLVFHDLEKEGYACGAVVLPACSIGAPHIRSRIWFVADAEYAIRGSLGRSEQDVGDGEDAGRPEAHGQLGTRRQVRDALGNASGAGLPSRERPQLSGMQRLKQGGATEQPSCPSWADAEWLPCLDGKARPVEPGTFPLAHGIPGRVGRLRAYGNAIVPQIAAKFIRAFMDCREV